MRINQLIFKPTSPDCKASEAVIGSPVSNMYADIFRGTALANGIPGVEQNRPTLLPGTENLSKQRKKYESLSKVLLGIN